MNKYLEYYRNKNVFLYGLPIPFYRYLPSYRVYWESRSHSHRRLKKERGGKLELAYPVGSVR